MKIIVLIKQVPSTANTRMDPEKGTVIRDAGDTVLNPLDEHAVTEAVKIKKLIPGTKIIALTMGPPSAKKILNEACARGVDEGVLLSHKAFGGSDTVATAHVLAAAVKQIGNYDLLLAGEKATDGETGQTGPMTAALLNIPVITFAQSLTVLDNKIYVQRMVEEGIEELSVNLPALVTVIKEINKPPLPTIRGYLLAKKVPIPIWGPDDINIEPGSVGLKGSSTRVVKIFSPKLVRDTKFCIANTEEGIISSVNTIMEVLTNRSLISKGDNHGS
ncbi:electron transfer flavoprotein subunit beta/FixA family protein [Desulfoscipio gibsoniae]